MMQSQLSDKAVALLETQLRDLADSIDAEPPAFSPWGQDSAGGHNPWVFRAAVMAFIALLGTSLLVWGSGDAAIEPANTATARDTVPTGHPFLVSEFAFRVLVGLGAICAVYAIKNRFRTAACVLIVLTTGAGVVGVWISQFNDVSHAARPLLAEIARQLSKPLDSNMWNELRGPFNPDVDFSLVTSVRSIDGIGILDTIFAVALAIVPLSFLFVVLTIATVKRSRSRREQQLALFGIFVIAAALVVGLGGIAIDEPARILSSLD